jgi:arginyl-tRNA synthetase
MQSVKQQLLAALAAELERPGAGRRRRRAFESPKAAHGDWACTAAMQLAKPLKANPRSWPSSSRRRWPRRLSQWVDAIEIAGPAF